MGSQDDNCIIDKNLADQMNWVELTIIEHQLLRIIVNGSHTLNFLTVKLACQQFQEWTENRYSIGMIKSALDQLYQRRIIIFKKGQVGPNLFFQEWVMHTSCQQQSKQPNDGQGDQQPHNMLPQQPATKPIIH